MADEMQVPDGDDGLEVVVWALMGRVDQLTEELAALRGEGARATELAPRPTAATPRSPSGTAGPEPGAGVSEVSDGSLAPPDGTTPRMSRRGALALGAAAAVGLGALADSVLAATPAGATTGTMQYGASNDAGSTATDLTSSAATQTLSVENTGTGYGIDVTSTGSAAALLATSNGVFPAVSAFSNNPTTGQHGVFAEILGQGIAVVGNSFNVGNGNPAVIGNHEGLGMGVKGWNSNPAASVAGVYGLVAGSGPGIEGQSTSGYGVKAQGGMAPLHLVPSGSTGAPTAGAHLVGELYVDSAGVVFSCQAAGTPGTWVPVLVGGAINDTGATETTLTSTVAQVALTVENTSTNSSAAALVGSDGGTGAGIGVRGECDNPANTSAAVEGITNGTGPALAGACLGAGYGAVVSGGLAPLYLVPAANPGAPASGTHLFGELYVDSTGVLYRCAAAGTPGTWVPQYSTVPLPSPVRVIATPSGTGGISGPLVPGATVHTSSVLTGTNGIPAGAVGIVANLAVSGVGGALLNGFGVMTIFPAGMATPATANINAGAGSFAESNAVTVAFGTGANAGKVSIVWNGGGAVPDAQAYLDVIAYLL